MVCHDIWFRIRPNLGPFLVTFRSLFGSTVGPFLQVLRSLKFLIFVNIVVAALIQSELVLRGKSFESIHPF